MNRKTHLLFIIIVIIVIITAILNIIPTSIQIRDCKAQGGKLMGYKDEVFCVPTPITEETLRRIYNYVETGDPNDDGVNLITINLTKLGDD